MDKQIKRVCILGGGSAGWMCAAAFVRALEKDCEIIVVESDEIGAIGVGEATIPPIKLFNQMLGISETDFVKATKGSFKLGIEFVNWGNIGERYFHPFGTHGVDFDKVPLHHYWLQERLAGSSIEFEEYSFAWALAKQNKFIPQNPDRRLIQSTHDYAYHFDAGLYAQFLRKLSEEAGVKRIEGKVQNVRLCANNGHIEGLDLENGEKINADFFVDCTGFSSLLLGKALETPFVDWHNFLPCDTAVAVPCENGDEDLTPYTRSTAKSAGWQWRIPLQHRVGNGYVYCSSFISDENAQESLLQDIGAPPLSAPRKIKFRSGHYKELWRKNCVAIGLASGFLEPLESTALHLIQTAITRILALFPNKDFDEFAINEFNRITVEEYERIRDFIILHYNATKRDDSALWKYVANMEIPDSLNYKIEHFKRAGRIVSMGPELFQNPSWIAVFLGQGIIPNSPEPLLRHRIAANSHAAMESLLRVTQEAAISAPKHQDFIAKYCAAN